MPGDSLVLWHLRHHCREAASVLCTLDDLSQPHTVALLGATTWTHNSNIHEADTALGTIYTSITLLHTIRREPPHIDMGMLRYDTKRTGLVFCYHAPGLGTRARPTHTAHHVIHAHLTLYIYHESVFGLDSLSLRFPTFVPDEFGWCPGK